MSLQVFHPRFPERSMSICRNAAGGWIMCRTQHWYLCICISFKDWTDGWDCVNSVWLCGWVTIPEQAPATHLLLGKVAFVSSLRNLIQSLKQSIWSHDYTKTWVMSLRYNPDVSRCNSWNRRGEEFTHKMLNILLLWPLRVLFNVTAYNKCFRINPGYFSFIQ